MKPCRLYFDEDTSDLDLVAALRNRGVDVLTVIEAGLRERPDEQQLEWATAQGRIIYTFNARDFCLLHREFMQSGRNHSGIVVGAQQRFSIGAQLRGLMRLMHARNAESMLNHIEFLSHWVGKP